MPSMSSQVKSVSLVLIRHDRAWDHIEGLETITIKLKVRLNLSDGFMILEPMGGVTGKHGKRKRVGLISRWSAPLCRLPVRAAIRVLGRKDPIVTRNL